MDLRSYVPLRFRLQTSRNVAEVNTREEKDKEQDKNTLLRFIRDMKKELPDVVYEPQPAGAVGLYNNPLICNKRRMSVDK